MRDKKRKEMALMEEAYHKVNAGPCGCQEHDSSEIDMAGRDLLKAHDYAAKLSEMVQQLPGLEGWVASKITKASDYLSSVYHYLDYEMNEKHSEGRIDHDHDQPKIAVMVKQPQEGNFNMGYEKV